MRGSWLTLLIAGGLLWMSFGFLIPGTSSEKGLACSRSSAENISISQENKVWEVLKSLGEPEPAHARYGDLNYMQSLSPDLIRRGEELVRNGAAKGPDGKQGQAISTHFKCVNCHNTQQEDPDLKTFDPDQRLTFLAQKGIPFYQATTFFGIVNRESWFNGDYVKRYGGRAEQANGSLVEAIQLCSEECAQGRLLEDWEVEAVLAYFWSLQLEMINLELKPETYQNSAKSSGSKKQNKKLRNIIKAAYAQVSPATFGKVPADLQAGYGLKGDSERGRQLFDLACQKCHFYGVSTIQFYDSKEVYEKFMAGLRNPDQRSFYEVIREGKDPVDKNKKSLYMPRFTEERMSDQQVEDLRAYFEKRAKE